MEVLDLVCHGSWVLRAQTHIPFDETRKSICGSCFSYARARMYDPAECIYFNDFSASPKFAGPKTGFARPVAAVESKRKTRFEACLPPLLKTIATPTMLLPDSSKRQKTTADEMILWVAYV